MSHASLVSREREERVSLSAMKTKADRMWDEFSAKLKEALEARLAVKAD